MSSPAGLALVNRENGRMNRRQEEGDSGTAAPYLRTKRFFPSFFAS
jgi:hypothetical protein